MEPLLQRLYLWHFFRGPSAAALVGAAVDHVVETVGHGDGRHSVDDGVLFQEHGGQADGRHGKEGGAAEEAVLPQPFAVHHRDVDADGVVHVDAGQHVGTGVHFVKGGYHGAENIFVRVDDGAEVCAVGVDGADCQADGHACKQKGAQPVKIPLVRKKEVQDGSGHIYKPEQIWDDKILIKRNIVVQRYMDNVVTGSHRLLQIEKPGKVDEGV